MRGSAALLLIALALATAARAECSLSLGSTVYRHTNLRSDVAPEATFGCQFHHFDVRARYFAGQDVMRERPWGPTEYVTSAHPAVSILRIWNFHPLADGRVQPQLGAGLLFKASDPPRMCGLVNEQAGGTYARCSGDPWTPLPVEFAFSGSLASAHWSLSLVHISNAYLHDYNWGQNLVELGYRW